LPRTVSLSRSLLITVALAVALPGCGGRAPSETVRYRDLLVEDGITSDRNRTGPEEAFCGDEHRWSRPLVDGEELSALLELGHGGRLLLGGCIDRPSPAEQEGGFAEPRALELTLERVGAGRSPGREPLTRTLELPPYSGRWEEVVDLSDFPPGPLRLRLRVALPAGRKLYLRDLALRHQAPAPAPLPSRAPSPARQVLLISVDTLRPDALGALGGNWETPHLDRLAAASEIWAPHYAGASWTKPSHASLLTGQSLHLHRAGAIEAPIYPGVPLLSERFRQGGFLTRGLVYDCTWLRPEFGFSRGFDEYQAVPWTLPQMVRRAVDWMAAHRDQPFFFFFHTFEVHSDFHRLPYEAPGVRLATVAEKFGIPAYGCREEACASSLLDRIDRGLIAPLPGEEKILRFLYGEGVRHVDEQMGVLLAELQELGLFDSMLIVFTADHGESFLEHGELLHGNPWNEVIRVPLLIKWPGGAFAGERRTAPTSALDVAPTLLAAAGLPREGLPGEDLRALSRSRPVFSWDTWYLVATEEWKAVFEAPDGDRLFHLTVDPGETENVATAEPEILARLRHLTEARLLADRKAFDEIEHLTEAEAVRPLSEEEIRRLKALGYLGGS